MTLVTSLFTSMVVIVASFILLIAMVSGAVILIAWLVQWGHHWLQVHHLMR